MCTQDLDLRARMSLHRLMMVWLHFAKKNVSKHDLQPWIYKRLLELHGVIALVIGTYDVSPMDIA